jgi:anti-sigma factor RsiW
MSAHDQVRPELVSFITGEASDETASLIRAHLETCGECRAELMELEMAAGLVRQSPAELAPPEGLEERTFELIEGRAPGVVGRGDTITAPAAPAPVPLAPKRKERRERAERRRRPLVAILAPGIAAALVLLGFVGLRLYQDNKELKTQLAQQEQRVDRLGEEFDTVTLVSAESSKVRAEAEVYKLDNDNFQIVLATENFPSTPQGYQYELWFGGDQGWLSAGSFRTSGARTMTFDLHISGDASEFSKVDLTLEPIDGNPGHTGPPVMQGELDPTAL